MKAHRSMVLFLTHLRLRDIHRILKPLESQSADVIFVDYAADAQQALWNNAFQGLHVDESAESSHGSPRSGSESSSGGDASSPGSAPTQAAQPQAQPMGPIEFDLEDDEMTQMIDSAWFLIVRSVKPYVVRISHLTINVCRK